MSKLNIFILQPTFLALLILGVMNSVSAKSTTAGTYKEGKFSMPELASGTDYYEVQVEEDGKQMRILRLPSGVSDFTLSAAGRPSSAFKWTFSRYALEGIKLEEYVPPSIAGLQLRSPVAGMSVRVNGPLRFQWDPVKDATGYVLSVTETGKGADPKPKEQSIAFRPDKSSPQGGPPYYYQRTGLSPKKEYSWQVSAIKDTDVIAKSVASPFSTKSTWFTDAQKAGWKLQRAFTLQESEQKKAEAATIGFTRQANKENAYNTEFALLYQLPGDRGSGNWASTFGASFEARLHSSGDGKKSDALRIRGTWEVDRNFGNTSLYTALSAKYETDRSKSTEKLLFEVLTAPTFGPIGSYWPGYDTDYTGVAYNEKSPLFQLRAQPYFGVDVGDNRKVGTSQEVDGNVLRWVSRMRLELMLPRLADVLGVDSVLIFGDGVIRKLPNEIGSPTYRTFSSGVDFALSDNLALSIRYSVGKDAPKFLWDRTSTVSIGAKF